MRSLKTVALFSSLLLLACAAGQSQPGQPTATDSAQKAPPRLTDVIRADELAKVGQGDLYTAIQRLRPSYLQNRGTTSPTTTAAIQVYVDGMKKGDTDFLKSINVFDVKEVRHLSAPDATQRYGIGHSMGAILVTSK